MKTQELTKLLKKNPYRILRNGSRHDMWISNLTGRHFTVPRHKSEIPVGTLKTYYVMQELNYSFIHSYSKGGK